MKTVLLLRQMFCLLSIYLALLFGMSLADSDPPVPIVVYPLDAKHGASPLTPSFLPPGTAVGVQFAEGPDGKPGGSSTFSGSQTSYIEFPKVAKLDTRYSITLLAMVYPESIGPLVQFSNNAYGPHLWIAKPISSNVLFWKITRRGDFVAADYIASNVLTQWYYVGATYDYSTGVVRLWVDGKKVGEKNVGTMEISTDQVIRMGAVSFDHARIFKGRISCLQIYNRSLTAEEIVSAKEACSPHMRSPYSMCFKYESINDLSRNVREKLSPPSVAADHNVLSEYKWYRFDGNAGVQLPTTCVAERHCGTQAPGWLSGLHPTRGSGTVKREVCFHSNGNCCVHKTAVYIRQCMGYYVYAFQEVPSSIKGRYCVEKAKAGNGQLISPPVAEVYTAIPMSGLVDHIIYSENHVTDPTTCAGYCSLNSQCRSFNYNAQESTCEISNTTRGERPALARTGFQYYEPLNIHAINYSP